MERKKMCIVAAALLALFAMTTPVYAAQEVRVPQDYPTVQAAITAAKDGDTIVVAPGTYRESLVIEKALVVRGEDAQSVILEGSIVVKAGEAVLIADLTVHAQHVGFAGAIRVEGPGKVTLEGVVVRRTGGLVMGLAADEGAKVQLIRCHFQRCNVGVVVGRGARVQLSQCHLEGGDMGISSLGAGVVTIADSIVVGSKTGIAMFEGELTMVNSTVADCKKDGVFASSAVITGCTITGNQGNGIILYNAPSGTVQGCTITGNGTGVQIREESAVTLERNTIESNRNYGVFAPTAIRVTGAGNRVFGNGVDLGGNVSSALRIPLAEPSATEIVFPDPRYPTLQHAVDALVPGGRLALRAGEYRTGLTLDKDVEIVGEEGAAVALLGKDYAVPVLSLISKATVVLRGLTITHGDAGVLVAAAAKVIISNCTLFKNDIGIVLAHKAQAVVTRSTIAQNLQGGAYVGDEAGAEFTACLISGNYMGGIFVADRARLRLIANTIEGHGMGYGVAIMGECRRYDDKEFLGRISGKGNLFRDNAWGDVCPPDLGFLTTEEGGELDRRSPPAPIQGGTRCSRQSV